MYRVNRNVDSFFHFLSVAIALLCIAGVDAQTQPNVVFILADDLGTADVSYHGSAVQTPNIDRLVETGVRLENYYVQFLCTPTRSALLSGRYQIHTGLQHSVILPCQQNSLPPNFPTIASMLQNQGYSTHMVGKWHLGHFQQQLTPLYRGFDSFFGHYLSDGHHYNHTYCTTINDQKLCGLDLRDGDVPTWDYTGQYSTHLFTEKAIEIIKEHATSCNEKPLFLYLPYQAVHSPNQVPDKYIEPYRNITDKPRRVRADNGGPVDVGGYNWPLRGWKGSYWEGGMKAVGFVNSPLIQQPGTTNNGLIHVTDWFPTILTLAGGSTDGLDLDGFDVWQTISEGTESPRFELLHNIDELEDKVGENLNISGFDNRITAAIRFENWKLITGEPGNGSWVAPPEDPDLVSIRDPDPNSKNIWLFDLSTDPNETTDVFEENQDVAADLLSRLRQYQSIAVEARFPDNNLLCDPALSDGIWGPWVD